MTTQKLATAYSGAQCTAPRLARYAHTSPTLLYIVSTSTKTKAGEVQASRTRILFVSTNTVYMKEIKLKLYDYDELSEEAKEKALSDWNEHNDDPFMQSHMINLLKEELDERGIKYDEDSIDVRYSLAHCQGDGFMFIGIFYFEGHTVKVKHDNGRYYHKYSRDIDIYDDETQEDAPEQVYTRFDKLYESVCDTMEQKGYEYIEWVTSEEHFAEVCEANGYTFEADGTMRNV